MNNQAVNWDFGDDLGQAAKVGGADDIAAAAHIVNGGNATFACPKCGGSGQTRWGRCFKCNGKGSVSKGVIAAAKGKATKAANQAQWRADHAAEVAYASKRSGKGSTFYASLIGSLETYGSWTENQIAMIQRDMAKDAEFWAAKNAEKVTKSGEVGVDRINALFATAIENGLKKPMFRTEYLTVKPAKMHAGVLYVMDKRVPNNGPYGGPGYAGKIVEGKFVASREAKADTLTLLCEIAGDPTEAAVKYGRATGNCGCCGRELTDPESVAAGIGPICAGKWGI